MNPERCSPLLSVSFHLGKFFLNTLSKNNTNASQLLNQGGDVKILSSQFIEGFHRHPCWMQHLLLYIINSLNVFEIDNRRAIWCQQTNNLLKVNTVEKKWLIALEPERTSFKYQTCHFLPASLRQNISVCLIYKTVTIEPTYKVFVRYKWHIMHKIVLGCSWESLHIGPTFSYKGRI